jgi:hypothetical protein
LTANIEIPSEFSGTGAAVQVWSPPPYANAQRGCRVQTPIKREQDALRQVFVLDAIAFWYDK